MTQEPLWWQEARELRAKGWTLKRIAQEVGRHYTSVLYAVRNENFRERHREKSRQRWAGRPYPWVQRYDARGSVVRAAREESRATGTHIDAVLIAWGTNPRRSTIMHGEGVG